MLKRLFDILASSLGLLLLGPLFLCLAIAVKIDSSGPVFYRQIRIGRNQRSFSLFKFRSMAIGSDAKGLLTVGGRDSRITRVGYFIRKYKLDELPQLINVFKGDMSLVGPRPEVPRYVAMYSADQLRVLSVRPGITDYASLKYFSENEMLAASANPEKTYIEEIMPAKLKINLDYVDNRSMFTDIKIILLTLKRIVN
jgi:lipopolysaccharide/colanic/teichoic acid biosynthesis glycosyltransferase